MSLWDENVSAYDIGYETITRDPENEESLGYDIKDIIEEIGLWEDDSWGESDYEGWWENYGEGFWDIFQGWDPQQYSRYGQERDIGLEGYRENFRPSDANLGKTGFAEAQGIGQAGELGGEQSWREEYELGLSPFMERYEEGTRGMYSAIGENILSQFAILMGTGAFGSAEP